MTAIATGARSAAPCQARNRRPAVAARPARRQADPQPRAGRPRRERPGERREAEVSRIYGFHSVVAALKAPRRELIRLYASPRRRNGFSPGRRARDRARIMTSRRSPPRAARGGSSGRAARGAAACADRRLRIAGERPRLVLDQVTDPHNFGAILRTGAPSRSTRSPPPTPLARFAGALAKSASGGLEHVPIARRNLARALDEMGDLGFFGSASIRRACPARAGGALAPVRSVLGAEGRGLRRLTRERCDCSPASICPARSRASTSRTPARSLSRSSASDSAPRDEAACAGRGAGCPSWRIALELPGARPTTSSS